MVLIRNPRGGTGGDGGLIETARDSTPIVDDAQVVAGANWFGQTIQLPATENFYTITHLETKIGTVAVGTSLMAAFLVDALNPSVINSQRVIACRTPQFVPVINTTHKIKVEGSYIFRPEAFIFIALNNSSNSTERRFTAGASENRRIVEAYTANPLWHRTVGFTATTTEQYMKAYIFGYS